MEHKVGKPALAAEEQRTSIMCHFPSTCSGENWESSELSDSESLHGEP